MIRAAVVSILLVLAPAPEKPAPEAGRAVTPKTAPLTCCKMCTRGKACGNSCIARNKTCRQPPGCACDAK